MTLVEKAQEVLRLTKEIVEEGKALKNQKIAGIFRVFEDEFVGQAEVIAKLVKDAE